MEILTNLSNCLVSTQLSLSTRTCQPDWSEYCLRFAQNYWFSAA